jgi:hypothetical protein
MSQLALTVPRLRQFVESLGADYSVEATPGAWNLMGLRAALPVAGSSHEIGSVDNVTDEFNDTLLVFGTQRATGQEIVHCFKGTVDPGRYYTVHPMNPAGCAHLLNGQHVYGLGWHGKNPRYRCLVPLEPVAIWRDKNANFRRDPNEKQTVSTDGSIHIHAGGTRRQIARNSAGCQNVWGWLNPGSYWQQFMSYILSSTVPRFFYTLADAHDLIEFAQHGSGNVDPAAPSFTPEKRQALEQVLDGIACLYDYQKMADLGTVSGQSFEHKLNVLRDTGILRNLKPTQRRQWPPAADANTARQAMLEGFRLVYTHWREAGLDHHFHRRLNELRVFGPLRG